jgi:alkyldihydroxyacetonephosphate synthase
MIVPFGGGSTVAMHLSLDPEEKRMIVSLDTSRMESILWVDKVN